MNSRFRDDAARIAATAINEVLQKLGINHRVEGIAVLPAGATSYLVDIVMRDLTIDGTWSVSFTISTCGTPLSMEYLVKHGRSSTLLSSSSEFQEQQAIERLALSRHPEATGVKEIKPFLMTDEKADAWFVILTTSKEFEFITTLVTAEDLRAAN